MAFLRRLASCDRARRVDRLARGASFRDDAQDWKERVGALGEVERMHVTHALML